MLYVILRDGQSNPELLMPHHSNKIAKKNKGVWLSDHRTRPEVQGSWVRIRAEATKNCT